MKLQDVGHVMRGVSEGEDYGGLLERLKRCPVVK
jgi:hypothetical protein